MIQIFYNTRKTLLFWIGDGHGADNAKDDDAFTILTYGNGAGFNKNTVSEDGDIVRPERPQESR